MPLQTGLTLASKMRGLLGAQAMCLLGEGCVCVEEGTRMNSKQLLHSWGMSAAWGDIFGPATGVEKLRISV